MSSAEKQWLSLTKASERLGVHPTTLRRWVDTGSIPCFRTPGGHRRFRAGDLDAWTEQGHGQTTALVTKREALLDTAVGFTRKAIAEERVASESWYQAFEKDDERERMRDSGRRLFGLALQYIVRTREREPVLLEGRRIGESLGEQCGRRGVSLAGTVRGFSFFRQALVQSMRPGLVVAGRYDEEDVRIHRQLREFLDEVLYACLARYETVRYQILNPDKENKSPTAQLGNH